MLSSKSHPDYILLGASIFLVIFGILILASVSAVFSQREFGEPTYFLFHQIIFGLIPGIILGYIAFKLPIASLKKWAPIFLLVVLLFMALVFVPKIGTALGGASRWINLGQFSFQPSEFLKIAFILYLAAWLTSRTKAKIKEQKKDFLSPAHLTQTLIPFLVIIGVVSSLLIFQPDISTLVVMAGISFLMYFSSKTPFKHSILIFLLGIGGLAALIKIAPYRFNRFLVLFDPGIDPLGIGYQLKQSLIAIGSGGIWGQGLGFSHQQFGFLPQAMSDSIFAIFAEETGFVGSLVLILLFLVFVWQGFKIAKLSPDRFSQLAALGISSWIIIQGFINIGAMVGILPLTGIPLPFFSHGGSHLIAELVGVGILLNISRRPTRKL